MPATIRPMSATGSPPRRFLPTRGYAMAGLVVLGAIFLTLALLFIDWRRIGPVSASLSYEATVQPFGTMLVDGLTDLPDATVIDWDVVGGSYSQPGGAPLVAHGQTRASGGRFRFTVEDLPMASGTLLSVGVRFYPAVEQPAAVVARFGPNGEHLRGPEVVDDSGTPVLLVIREVVVP